MQQMPLFYAYLLFFAVVAFRQSPLANTAVLGAEAHTFDEVDPLNRTIQETQARTNKDVPGSIIDFTDRASLKHRRPILIAHRGGVVAETSAECSLTAIRLAARQGYDMVELDVQISKDGQPVVFHDRTLAKACKREGRVADYPLRDLESISYVKSEDRIVSLDTALKVCRELKLGVMLDLKQGRDEEEFLKRIRGLLEKHDLLKSTITFSGSQAARRFLMGIRFTPTDDEMRRLRAGEKLDLNERFWFGLPKQLTPDDLERLKSCGALLLPAINTFRYPTDKHKEHAKKDIERLTPHVDGFQIDSVYRSLFAEE